MRDFLKSGLTVRQKQRYSFTPDARLCQALGNPHCGAENLGARLFLKLGQSRSMNSRDHQNVSGVHREDVHESENSLIRVHNTGWSRISHYLTEHTIFQLVPSQKQRRRINMNFHVRRLRKTEEMVYGRF